MLFIIFGGLIIVGCPTASSTSSTVQEDADDDGIPDNQDICEGHDDNIDTDVDGVPDGCDICEGYDDNIDTDGDGIPDGCDNNQPAFCSDPKFVAMDSFFDVFFEINACGVSTDQVSLLPVIWSGFGHPAHDRPLNGLSSFATGAAGPLMLTNDQINLFDNSWPCDGMSNPPEIFTETLLIADEVSWFCGIYCAEPPGKLKIIGNNTVVENPLVFINVMHADIPQDDQINIYTYAFVFDRDGNAGNNYQPSANFPNDFYKDTDYWIELSYVPGSGWGLSATDASNNSFIPYASDAKIVVVNNTLFLVIPRSEFFAENIGYRMTTFRHTGDWGMSDDNWDGDVQPPVADGLNWLNIGP